MVVKFGEAVGETAEVLTAGSGGLAKKTLLKTADNAAENIAKSEATKQNEATKKQVLLNIAESKNARESSNFGEYVANEKQVLGEVAKNADELSTETKLLENKNKVAGLLEDKTASTTIIGTNKGVSVSSNTLLKQGTSSKVGDFTNLAGASVDEIISRVPKEWKIAAQNDGKGFKFIDESGVERIRIHAPSMSKKNT